MPFERINIKSIKKFQSSVDDGGMISYFHRVIFRKKVRQKLGEIKDTLFQ